MKVLTESNLIDLLSPEPETAEISEKLFEALAPVVAQKGFLNYAVREGFFECGQVNYNGVPAYVLWHHKSPDGGLWIDAVQTLSPGNDVLVAFLAVDKIARREHCRYIRFLTMRKGLYVQARRLGYHADGVMLNKNL